ncbi:hypothetical protein [Vibrio phage LV6]|nr:hypothetical protein [Vibrio phage LV6]
MDNNVDYPDELFYMMQAVDDDNLSDGAWQQVLEDTAEQFADMQRSDGKYMYFINPNDAFHAYLKWSQDNKK